MPILGGDLRFRLVEIQGCLEVREVAFNYRNRKVVSRQSGDGRR